MNKYKINPITGKMDIIATDNGKQKEVAVTSTDKSVTVDSSASTAELASFDLSVDLASKADSAALAALEADINAVSATVTLQQNDISNIKNTLARTVALKAKYLDDSEEVFILVVGQQ